MPRFFKGITKYIDNHLGNALLDNKSVEVDENINDLKVIEQEDIGVNKAERGIRVKNGEIQIKGSGNIIPCEGIELYINDKKCTSLTNYLVNENDKIKCIIIQNEETREIHTHVSKDKMKVLINIQYNGTGEKVLQDSDWSNNLYLKCVSLLDKSHIEKYTIDDIKNLLKENNIIKGIDESKFEEICENGTDGEYIEIAQGIMPIDDIPSTLKIMFDLGKKNLLYGIEEERIDYKNIYSINNVNEGDVLAEIIPRVDGVNGYNVLGEELKRKIENNEPVKIGEGCKIKGNKIVATKNGRPSCKNGIISVNNVYKVKNVDLKSGNIKFVGDVEIEQGVCEGMTVNAGNSIFINKGVDSAVILAGGEINIKGNIINSKIRTGQIDIEKKLYLDNLKTLRTDIKNLIECTQELMKRIDVNMNFSEVVKVLIENKFRSTTKLIFSIISESINMGIKDHEIIKLLKNKLIGANISNMKSINELIEIKHIINDEINFYEDDMIIQSDINISYCQDSLIKSTGKIKVIGKGCYVSDIIALNEVEFINKDAVARGGKISSMKSVTLGTVGSLAGVRTIIEVPESGTITANMAYHNTKLVFGKKSKIIDCECKNVKAYVDKFGNIQIEKIKL